MKRVAACATAGAALWCSLGTVGLAGSPSAATRLALLPHWWLLPISIRAMCGVDRLARLTSAQLSVLIGSGLTILPWLPVPLPAATLIWTGPCILAVWTAVVAGVIATSNRSVRAEWLA